MRVKSLETQQSEVGSILARHRAGKITAEAAVQEGRALQLAEQLIDGIATLVGAAPYAAGSKRSAMDDAPVWGPSRTAELLSQGFAQPLPRPAPLKKNEAARMSSQLTIDLQLEPSRFARAVLAANPETKLTLDELIEVLREPLASIRESLAAYEDLRSSQPGYDALCLKDEWNGHHYDNFRFLTADGVSIPVALTLNIRVEQRMVDGIPRPVTVSQPLTTQRLAAEWAWELAAQLESEALELSRATAGYAWQPDRGQKLLRYPGIEGFGLALERPDDTVTFYRGTSKKSAAEIEARARAGFYAHPVGTGMDPALQRLEPRIAQFLALPPLPRKEWIRTQALTRKWEGMPDGTNSSMVGGSVEQAAAKQFGNVTYQLEVPRELLFQPRKDGVHDGEDEQFVPFAMHPSWIKRVLGKDGTVLFDFEASPAQRVTDSVLIEHLAR